MKQHSIWILILCSMIWACNTPKQEENPNNTTSKVHPDIEKYSKEIETNPYNALSFFNRANAYFELGNLLKAQEDVSQSLSIDSLHLPSLELKAKIHFEMQAYQDALQTLKKYIQLDPGNASTHISIAKIYVFITKYQEAIDHVNQSLRINKFDPEAYFLKGYCYKQALDTARATSAFQTAIEMEPNFLKAYMQLALFAFDQKDPLCVEYYNQALRIDPMNEEAYYGKGLFYQEIGDLKNAKATYRSLLNINHQSEKAYYNLGYVYLISDSLEKAYKHFNAACRVDPAYENAYYNRGLVSERLGKYQNAMNDYRQALSLNPEHPLANEALERVKKILSTT